MPSYCGTRPGMPLQHARHWGWWTRSPPCGSSSGTFLSGGTSHSLRLLRPARKSSYTHRSGTPSGSSARALGPPMMWSRPWAMTRRTWWRSLCYPYPWEQCEPGWDNRVGWIPHCEDAAPSTHPHPHTHPSTRTHTDTHETHGASAPQCRARRARPVCCEMVALNMSAEPHCIWPPTSCVLCVLRVLERLGLFAGDMQDIFHGSGCEWRLCSQRNMPHIIIIIIITIM